MFVAFRDILLEENTPNAPDASNFRNRSKKKPLDLFDFEIDGSIFIILQAQIIYFTYFLYALLFYRLHVTIFSF